MPRKYEHHDVVRRWADSRMNPGAPDPYPEHKSGRMIARGDVLYSWGTHFPLVRAIRKRGKVVQFLLNGDTWGGRNGWAAGAGNDTSNHQRVVLRVIEEIGLPYVTVPQSVLDAAGIDDTSVTLVHRTADWYENKVEEFEAEPEYSRWVYDEETVKGTGVWVHHRTGTTFTAGWQTDGNGHRTYETSPPGQPTYGEFVRSGYDDKPAREAEYQQYLAAERRWQLEWTKYPAVTKRTGRKHLVYKGHQLEQYQREDGTVGSRYHWRRHWLGESLIKAKIPHTAEVRCPTCRGTGLHPHAEAFPGAEGPLTERQDSMWHRWQTHGTGPEPRHSIGSRIEERCETCASRRTIRATRFRTAYFLSGFDHNEPLPSYFFTELPPDARPSTIDEAYEALKPATVRLAEEMGRTVHRQGDQFFIEMPGLTLRELKRQGGEHHKRGGPGREKQQWEPEVKQSWHQPPRFQRYINENCWLNGTTHEASEVVRLGGATYVRGIVRHVPDGRTPDHVPLHLGTKSLWLNVPNRTPVGR
jgi:hypothetical protein